MDDYGFKGAGLRLDMNTHRRIHQLTVLAAIFLLTPFRPTIAQQASGSPEKAPVVNCLDPVRGTVSRSLAAECHGSVISDANARTVHEQRVQSIQRAIRERQHPIFTDKRMVSIGTGFFVSDSGHIVTNRHVVERCDALSVETTTGTTASAQLVRFDGKLDIALVKANTIPPATAVFQTRDVIRPGGSVAVIGYPDQGLPPRKPLMAIGSAVAVDRELHGERLAIRANVRPGNSGGPVLDQWGNVVGIVNAKVDTVRVYSQTKQLIRDVGFAISTSAIVRFLDESKTPYRQNALGALLNADQIFERARPFVVRIGCWR